ncbi:hypothetical protein RJ641_017491 [Dillenia turbinata]|uniref:DUF7865 domain-containing protein n=1 Tax=Dillenia turbinata TaxID=194707 RepID=A0AAN8UTW9_9MAGN
MATTSSGFFLICFLHSLVALISGSLIMFYLKEISILGHGIETARKLLGSTPHDQLLIQISDSFAGFLLFTIGFLLFMVSFVKDSEFQSFFAKGCVCKLVELGVLLARLRNITGPCKAQTTGLHCALFGVLSIFAALAVAVPATLVTWITILVLLAFFGKPRTALVIEGRKLTVEISGFIVKVLIKEGNIVAAVCAVLGYFLLVRSHGNGDEI